jgi:hypothetical protein
MFSSFSIYLDAVTALMKLSARISMLFLSVYKYDGVSSWHFHTSIQSLFEEACQKACRDEQTLCSALCEVFAELIQQPIADAG